MYKFFVEDNQIENNEIKIIGDDLKHISNVLRIRIGEEILITNKSTAETYKSKMKLYVLLWEKKKMIQNRL